MKARPFYQATQMKASKMRFLTTALFLLATLAISLPSQAQRAVAHPLPHPTANPPKH